MTARNLTDLQLAHAMADAAREAILPFFRAVDLVDENKLQSGYDPVTKADRAAERVMRDLLTRHRPDDAIWGEEYGHQPGASGRTWVLDPIDGTRGFVAGTPTWGVLIALTLEDGPILGVIDQPYIGERFTGDATEASWTGPLGQRPLACRDTTDLGQAILFTTFPEVGQPRDRDGFQAVSQHVKLTRYGMDCYAYALVAAGQIDLVIEAELNAYDIQAPIAVIQAAGGVVTGWSGAPAHDGGQVVAAANPTLHAKALELLGPFAEA